MVSYIVRRVVYMVFVLVAISMVAFVIIQLPPGDYVTNMIDNMRLRGERVTDELIELLARRYGLDMPLHQQYLRWAWRILHGDFGRSMEYQRPVSQLIGDRLTLTVIISMSTLVFTYVMAIPIGIYSATRQYSVGDYLWTFFGFIGLATPNFLLAMILMLFFSITLGMDVGGLFLRGVRVVRLEHRQGLGPDQAPAHPHHSPRDRRHRGLDTHPPRFPAR